MPAVSSRRSTFRYHRDLGSTLGSVRPGDGTSRLVPTANIQSGANGSRHQIWKAQITLQRPSGSKNFISNRERKSRSRHLADRLPATMRFVSHTHAAAIHRHRGCSQRIKFAGAATQPESDSLVEAHLYTTHLQGSPQLAPSRCHAARRRGKTARSLSIFDP